MIWKSLTEYVQSTYAPFSSIERVLFYIDPDQSLTRSIKDKRVVANLLNSVTRHVEQYLQRDIIISSKTEYFDSIYGQRIFYPSSYPVWQITSVKIDGTGEFAGQETTLDTDEYFINPERSSIVVERAFSDRERCMQLVYTAGLAYHATHSVYECSQGSTQLSVGNYVKADSSESIGKVIAVTDDTITLEVIDGIFQIETITGFEDIIDWVPTGAQASITGYVQRSLAESNTDICRAVELQCSYMYRHASDFENIGTNTDGTTLRRQNGTAALEPEVRLLLDPYRKVTMFS